MTRGARIEAKNCEQGRLKDPLATKKNYMFKSHEGNRENGHLNRQGQRD